MSSRATAVTTTKRRPIAAAASATRARLVGVGRAERPRGGDVAEAAPARAAAAGDHEGGRAPRPALADVRAGRLLADRHEIGRAHQGLGADEAARERVLGGDPARQAAAPRRAGPARRRDVDQLEGARAARRRRAGRRSGRRARGPAARASAIALERVGHSGHVLHPESALAGHVPTVADPGAGRYARRPWSSPTEPSARSSPAGRLVIDPFDEALLQPSSVDVRVARRASACSTTTGEPFIDVREPDDDLTEVVDDPARRALHPAPRRVRARLHRRAGRAAGRPRRAARGQVEPRSARPADPLDRRLHRPRLRRHHHPRAVERRAAAHLDLPRDGDRPDLVPPDDDARRAAPTGQVPGSERARRRAPSTASSRQVARAAD